ncbi:hypothetical protein VTK56DRAFT_4017 [Thermocarpiscus australiensis]
MTLLTQLSPEIIHKILSFVEPEDLGRLPLTCRCLNTFVKGNNALCRDIYLRILDEPPSRDLDFEQELHDLVRLKILCSPKSDSTSTTTTTTNTAADDSLPFVTRTVSRLLNHARRTATARTTTSLTYPPSRNAALLTALFTSSSSSSQRTTITTTPPPAAQAFMSRSFLFERARLYEAADAAAEPSVVPRPPREDHQLSAKLHCLYGCGLSAAVAMPAGARWPWGGGWAVAIGGESSSSGSGSSGSSGNGRMGWWGEREARMVYPVACAKVYDMREYTVGTRWGPFLDEGDEDGEGEREERGVRVDWEKMEAIMIVLGTNIRSKGLEAYPIFGDLWGRPFAGVWSGSYIPSKGGEDGKEKGDLERRDPYGVSGSWMRIVCFLDYADFFSFNFPPDDRLPSNAPRPPLNVGEATRVMMMRVRVTKIEPPGVGDHPDHPVVHFNGISRSLDGENPDSDLRGTARMTPEGEVRWTTYSIFNGEERWKSEGIQLGGIRSARGVVGTWFDKDYNERGPCGSMAYWKMSDRVQDG